jgi:hypothetical protein
MNKYRQKCLTFFHKSKQIAFTPYKISTYQRITVMTIIMILTSSFTKYNTKSRSSRFPSLTISIQSMTLHTLSHKYPTAIIYISIYRNILIITRKSWLHRLLFCLSQIIMQYFVLELLSTFFFN